VAAKAPPSSFSVKLMVGLLLAVAVLAVLAGLAVPAQAQTQELPPELEQRAHALYKQVMCPTCPGQTIDQSRSPVASSMRQIVRERLLAGDTDAQILAFFVDAYGESVLAAPPRDGVGLAAWLVPPFALLLGGVAVFVAVRTLRRPAAVTDAGPRQTEEDTADPYLRLVDEEMGIEDRRLGQRRMPAPDEG
jgi:cytochrome c-type biogenesis protein CcmH